MERNPPTHAVTQTHTTFKKAAFFTIGPHICYFCGISGYLVVYDYFYIKITFAFI